MKIYIYYMSKYMFSFFKLGRLYYWGPEGVQCWVWSWLDERFWRTLSARSKWNGHWNKKGHYTRFKPWCIIHHVKGNVMIYQNKCSDIVWKVKCTLECVFYRHFYKKDVAFPFKNDVFTLLDGGHLGFLSQNIVNNIKLMSDLWSSWSA